jgi:hypothetical protein
MSDAAQSAKMSHICLLCRIGDAMKDLKFEQKRSLSRLEAADQLMALATALREGGDAELELDPGKLSVSDQLSDPMRTVGFGVGSAHLGGVA